VRLRTFYCLHTVYHVVKNILLFAHSVSRVNSRQSTGLVVYTYNCIYQSIYPARQRAQKQRIIDRRPVHAVCISATLRVADTNVDEVDGNLCAVMPFKQLATAGRRTRDENFDQSNNSY